MHRREGPDQADQMLLALSMAAHLGGPSLLGSALSSRCSRVSVQDLSIHAPQRGSWPAVSNLACSLHGCTSGPQLKPGCHFMHRRAMARSS